MKRNYTECDRCHKEISPPHREVKVVFVEHHEKAYDLCKDCVSAVQSFIEDGPQTGIPRGFKMVPRPCPHHVPCADPRGCSGFEIVPR